MRSMVLYCRVVGIIKDSLFSYSALKYCNHMFTSFSLSKDKENDKFSVVYSVPMLRLSPGTVQGIFRFLPIFHLNANVLCLFEESVVGTVK